MALLALHDLSCSFGGVTAVDRVSFQVGRGEIVAVIGPNGAGKTTLFNLITGVLTPTAGRIHFRGREITGARPYELARLGISRTFQNLQIFHGMTVLENVMVGLHPRLQTGLLHAAFRLPLRNREEARGRAEALALLERLGLGHLAGAPADSLPYGQQRLVEIARALAARPALLLLDEPVAGMNPAESARLAEIILRLRDEGLTFLLVEHDMETVMALSDRIVVLEYGRKIAEGPPALVRAHPRVIAAYLGEEAV